ncbi:preprotein translocase subunit SecE [Pilimelia columellifera]|uniref:preprotein translocase subunit SecE n=1 Tax=Pilimelia columellifera TaxID=706574 RepID=UPI0031D7866D
MAENERRGEEPADENGNEQTDAAGAEPAAEDTTVEKTERAKRDTERGGPIGRVGRFFREVVSEMRKVIWPTRKELVTYTVVVIVFVTIMTSIVAGLDYGFGKAVLAVFGDEK